MAKTVLAALFGWTTILFGGCAERSVSPPATPEGRITTALQEVLSRNDAAFAIIEHSQSGKFVQFAGSKREPLLLDLPAEALTPEEWERAERLFSSLGGTRTESGFQLETGRDAGGAARIALRVFREVYLLPEDVELSANVDS
ncbi:MAG: hypothetical protein KIS87_15000 [Phycisphaeraceae bacterium]|nr:hypothetical protein [Phycisphaeraceae bacterium]